MTIDRREIVYDLETGIGWALGSVLVLFARPVVWVLFHDWSSHRRPALHMPGNMSKGRP